MNNYNNMKKIREIYGATQEEIAKVAGVNRSTVSQWETGSVRASSSKLEKLSIFYGIGPECFYELPDIDDVRKNMLIKSAKREKEVKEASENERNKVDDFAQMLQLLTFNEARARFMIAMKLLLSTADDGKLEDLELAYKINQKMAKRLEAIIDIRREEEKAKKEHSEDTLYDLLDIFSESKWQLNN